MAEPIAEVGPSSGSGTLSLFAVVGATGTGKTSYALDLAERLGNAEIVNVDAMQLYRGMDIGTAKLPESERRGIPHHMFDVLDVTDEASVAWYQPRARAIIEEIINRGNNAILVGGSGLYASSVLFDFAFPPTDPELRAQLEAEVIEVGPGVLYERLKQLDPAAAERIDAQNPRRVVRALEVVLSGNQTHEGKLPDEPQLWLPDTKIFGMHRERAELVTDLDKRVEQMWADGMLDEVTRLRAQGLKQGVTASRAIGYAQALKQLMGEYSEQEAIAETQALTRRYARRQVSWFKRYPGLTWVTP